MNRIMAIVIVGLGCAISSGPARANASTVLSIGTIQGEAGKDVEVPIRIQGAKDLKTLQVRLSCDPAVLEVKKVEVGGAAGSALVESDSDAQGFTGMGLYGGDPINADGVVFKVLAHVRGATGQTSPLKLEFARAWNGTNRTETLISGENGQFTVTGSAFASQLNSWWPTAAYVVGGLALLLIVIAVARSLGGKKRAPSQSAADAELPTFGTAAAFDHRCTSCQQVINLPGSAIGKRFKCAGCGAVQVATR